MSYLPIADYGVIGDLRSIALVGINGSIDWCCLPRFDSPSIFGGILDHHTGGWWKLAPAGEAVVDRVLTGDEPIEASTLANAHYASALCRALLTALAAIGLKTSVREFAAVKGSVIALALFATAFLAAFIIVGLLWHRG